MSPERAADGRRRRRVSSVFVVHRHARITAAAVVCHYGRDRSNACNTRYSEAKRADFQLGKRFIFGKYIYIYKL